jgi:CheY-like chemotaxis protein
MMPIKDGFTLAQEIRAVNPEMPIIFLTAKTLKEDIIEGFKIGADDYITKHFSMEELVFRIEAVLRRVRGKKSKENTYYKIGRYKSAIVALKNAIKQYPETPYAEDIRYYTAVSAYRLAENSVASKQLDRYLDMLDHYYTFLAEYPESKRVKELERMAKSARNFIDKNRSTDKE